MTNKKNSGRGKTSRPLIAKTDMRIRPNKVRGQNFLVDKKVIEKIVQLGDLDADDVVLEIGAGLGAITKPLSELGNHITALEIEDDFVLYLKAAFINNTHVHIVHADARSYDYSCFNQGQPYVLYGNLPYSITSVLINKLLISGGAWKRMVLLLQKEAAERIAYGKGKDNGPLSILAAYYGHCEVCFDVSGSSFSPPPAVTSAVLKIERLSEPPVQADIHQIMRLVEAAFANRRKTLVNGLLASPFSGDREYWKQALRACGLPEDCRAEALSLQDFAALSAWIKEENV